MCGFKIGRSKNSWNGGYFLMASWSNIEAKVVALSEDLIFPSRPLFMISISFQISRYGPTERSIWYFILIFDMYS